MAKLLGIKAEATSVVDFVGAGFFKCLEEPVLANIVGNANIMSGVTKAVIASVISGRGGKIGNMAAMAFGIDAGEDIAISLMGMLGMGSSGESDTVGEIM